jgi:hypothetical protein
MNREQHQKVTPRHLKRTALLYVRQSTMRQVFENTESSKRQYALHDRAVALDGRVTRSSWSMAIWDTPPRSQGIGKDSSGW